MWGRPYFSSPLPPSCWATLPQDPDSSRPLPALLRPQIGSEPPRAGWQGRARPGRGPRIFAKTKPRRGFASTIASPRGGCPAQEGPARGERDAFLPSGGSLTRPISRPPQGRPPTTQQHRVLRTPSRPLASPRRPRPDSRRYLPARTSTRWRGHGRIGGAHPGLPPTPPQSSGRLTGRRRSPRRVAQVPGHGCKRTRRSVRDPPDGVAVWRIGVLVPVLI